MSPGPDVGAAAALELCREFQLRIQPDASRGSGFIAAGIERDLFRTRPFGKRPLRMRLSARLSRMKSTA
jgi:hypothetical protein